MNEKEHIVLIKHVDKTCEVKSVIYFNSKYQVTFNNLKTYSYNRDNVIFQPINEHYENCEKLLVLVNNKDTEARAVYKSLNYAKVISLKGSSVYKSYEVKILPCIDEILELDLHANNGTNNG